ncbi:MAG: hypothetical protein INR66_22645, partial [Gordonia polyisoprenivorans]|nr:hypothetical protein [Gordonia polyisoprenivorans]
MSDEPRRVLQLHPALTDVLQRVDGTVRGRALRDRAVEVSTIRAFGDPIDRAEALTAFRWFLDQAAGDGFRLTQAGY